MECNKEEAERCKAISEANFKKLDFVGARKYALKARHLFPDLDGLPQLISILDVHIASIPKLHGGEANWYGILQVDFRADENTLRKQYRKLALVLHPDKNKAFGAEAAFKHVSEAWSVLSDRDKKSRFDERWRAHLASRSVHPPCGAFQNANVHSPQVFEAKVKRSKLHNVYLNMYQAHQGQGHVHQQQGQGKAHVHQWKGQGQEGVHHQQGQGQGQAQAQGHLHQHGGGQAHACQQQGQGQGQGLGQAHVYQQQGQGKANVHQQQGQGHGQARVYQEKGLGQGHAHQEQGQGRDQAHVHQQQGQDQAHIHHQQQGQGQGQAHAHQQQWQGQAHAHQQQGQSQVHAHPKQEQGSTQFPQHGQGVGHARFSPTHHAEQNRAHASKPSQSASPHNKSTFWTACPSCRMQLEYEIAYINKNLCCPMCYRPFVSKETVPIQGDIIWPRPNSPALKKDAGPEKLDFDKRFGWVPCADSRSPQMVDSNKKGKTGTEDNNLLGQHGQKSTAHPAQIGVKLPRKGLGKLVKDELRKKVPVRSKRALEKLIARSKEIIERKLSEEKERKAAADKASANGKLRQQHQGAHKEKSAAADQAPVSGLYVQNRPVEMEWKARVYNTEEKENDADACTSRVWTRNSTGSSKEIRVSQEGCSFVKHQPAGTVISNMETSQQKRKLATPMDESIEDHGFLKKLRQNTEQKDGILKIMKGFRNHQSAKDSIFFDQSSLQLDAAGRSAEECEMEVPDSDFHNFDGDRTEGHFSLGQIWACYDDDDGMPRYYARVNKILSVQPLKMQMNWLEACNPSDETLAWLDSGFQHTCGEFKLGGMYVAEQVSTFSHLMAVDKAVKGHYQIYPRKGEVWAVYKDWEILEDKDNKRRYDMVDIVATFEEERGVQVSPLFKVAGFKTIFERKPGEDYIKSIPLQELRRFSHQVPAHRFAEGEVLGIRVNCLELDPASTPMNLITGEQ